jgi:hypothetical protein
VHIDPELPINIFRPIARFQTRWVFVVNGNQPKKDCFSLNRMMKSKLHHRNLYIVATQLTTLDNSHA